MAWSDQEFLERISRRNLRAVARLISLCENRSTRGRALLASLFDKTGRARVIGVTGSPGAGKSTLVDQLACLWRKQGKQVAILAIDPTSPFSGGAILGDRIRMVKAAEDSAIFVRSMATRGALGGLSRATLDAVRVLDSAGFDVILIETVGVGQAEVDIVRTADTCLVVLVPGMGDSVQSIKAGILEIADVFVVNKADREGADALQRDLRMLLTLTEFAEGAWRPEIVRTVATSGEGSSELIAEADRHYDWLRASTAGQERRETIIRDNILKLAAELAVEKILDAKTEALSALVKKCMERSIDPYSAAEQLLK